MDALNLDERQRLCWLRANRATLMLVGLCWLGMIGWSLLQQHTPVFLMIMVPVFAAVRYLFYLYYKRLA
jgi:hypothetical protein